MEEGYRWTGIGFLVGAVPMLFLWWYGPLWLSAVGMYGFVPVGLVTATLGYIYGGAIEPRNIPFR